jgi:3-phosphoshikimate 1-carboxyvinyltransferase
MMALCNDPTSEIKLTGLMDGSKQGDSTTRYIFSLLGVKTTFETKEEGVPQTITLSQSRRCVPRLEYDFVNAPDLAQTFVVTCAAKNVPFRFTGLSTLKIKETDRIEALKQEMRKLGYIIHDVNGHELYWDGERCEPDLELGIDTYEDHRMALAFAPYAFVTDGLTINNPRVVTKSYPRYWEDLKKVGFKIENL